MSQVDYLHPLVPQENVQQHLDNPPNPVSPVKQGSGEKDETSRLTVRRDLQKAFYDILEELELVADSATELTPLEKLSLENRILGRIQILTLYTEAFWEDISSSRDIFSYRFVKRLFPVYGIDENKIVNSLPLRSVPEPRNEKKVRVDPSVFRATREEKIKMIKAKYDLRESVHKTLNADYIDEGVGSRVAGPGGSTFSIYHAIEPSRYYGLVSQDVINRIFLLCKEKKLYGIMLLLFCLLAATREYYHLVINTWILDLLFDPNGYTTFTPASSSTSGTEKKQNPFLDPDYLEIIHHFLFYSMYLMYKEECIIKAHALPKNRFVLDLEAASRLPVYEGSIDTNPYLPLTLAASHIHATGISDQDYVVKPLRVSGSQRGLYSYPEFQERFKIFTDNIFDGMSTDKIWFGGSVIAACVAKNPLEQLFNIKNCGPAPSSVNMSRDNPSYDLYCTEVNKMVAHWRGQKQALNAYFDEYYPSKNVVPTRFMLAGANQSQIPEVEDQLSDIDIMVDILDDEEFDKKAFMILNHVRRILAERAGIPPSEVSDDKLQLIKIETKKSYKYYMSGTLLKRSLEIFRMYGTHPVGGVSRFHFPAVRGVYDGRRVLIFPSLVAYAMTGVFMDYKWMSSAKDTKDLILKYYIRGGFPILNEQEHKYLAKHIADNPKTWGIVGKYSEAKARSVSLMNPIFRPRAQGHGFYAKIVEALAKAPEPGVMDPVPFSNYTFLTEEPSFLEKWKDEERRSRFGFDLSVRFPSGHIRPLGLWKVQAYFDALRRSNKYASSS
jgi:hypothetical protein